MVAKDIGFYLVGKYWGVIREIRLFLKTIIRIGIAAMLRNM